MAHSSCPDHLRFDEQALYRPVEQLRDSQEGVLSCRTQRSDRTNAGGAFAVVKGLAEPESRALALIRTDPLFDHRAVRAIAVPHAVRPREREFRISRLWQSVPLERRRQ